MTAGMRVFAEPLRSLAAASVVVGYTAIGDPLVYPMRIMLVQNLTDAQVVFSLDGVNDHFTLPAGGFILLDLQANNIVKEGWNIAAQTTFYVKRVATPTAGNVYVSSFYGTAFSMMG